MCKLVKKNQPIKNTPWIVYSLILLYVLILVFIKYLLPYYGIAFQQVLRWLNSISSSHELIAWILALLFHGGVIHLSAVVFSLWFFGPNVEDLLGPLLFLIVYLICGAIAMFTHMYFRSSNASFLGSFGAVSGVVGVYAVLFPKAKADFVFVYHRLEIGRIELNALCITSAWFCLSIIAGSIIQNFSAVKEMVYIPFTLWTQMGGYIAGLACGFLFKMTRKSG